MTDRPTILVVDDEQLNRDLLRRMLTFEYVVAEAEDAFQAVSFLESGRRVDVMVLDQMMPGKNGTELAAEAKKRWPHLVAVLLTGYEDSPDVEEARRTGLIFELVGKPIRVAELRETIGRAVEESRRRQRE